MNTGMKLLIGFLTVAVLVLGYVIYRVENQTAPEPAPIVVPEEPKVLPPPVKVLPKIESKVEPKKVESKPPIKLEVPKTEPPRFELKIRSGHIIQYTPSDTNEKGRPK
jgi:hypothetical protein